MRCVMCDRDVCFACFFPDLDRCQRCIETHPDEVTAPVPFESRGMLRGFVPTLVGALSPRTTAPGFAIGDSIAKPLAFFLVTFVPLALLRGVIPYTHLLQFGALSRITVTPGSSRAAIAGDIARAAGASLLECTAQLVSLAICYVSLVGAFGRTESKRIGLRTIGYRAFLLPVGGELGVLPMLVAWLGPAALGQLNTIVAIGILPLLPFYLALHRSGRAVGRIDVWPGLFVVLVPWVLSTVVARFTIRAMMPWLPDIAMWR